MGNNRSTPVVTKFYADLLLTTVSNDQSGWWLNRKLNKPVDAAEVIFINATKQHHPENKGHWYVKIFLN